ncbi:MAG: hypothetical protein KDB88_01025 [Flavobacteriales bacterium]|nr:hypothetical protein [Flavobacteriales bacterium]
MESLMRTQAIVVGCSLLLRAAPLFGQMSLDIEPLSARQALEVLASGSEIVVPGIDLQAVHAEDHERGISGQLPLYGRVLPLDIRPDEAGQWTTLANGDRVWRCVVRSMGALAVELFYEDMVLPEGATLHVMDVEGGQVLGAFTSLNNKRSGLFATGQILGEACLIEYFEPRHGAGRGRFTISGVGHAYELPALAKADFCQVDVNCSEGADWQDQRDGVVRISVKQGFQLGWCTGSLVNNTAEDCAPYILTAFHCGLNSTTADLAQYKFYFNYQRTNCGTGLASASQLLTGCMKRADSNDDGGNAGGSDFMLLEMNDDPPAAYAPYWNGWEANGAVSGSGVCIHHPSGDEKKISTYTSQLITSALYWGGPQAFWRVVWSATDNGHGVTEGGSSGSPLFNSAKRIVGTLTGGTSCCTVNGCNIPGSGPTTPDYYGKVSYHWANNPNPPTEKLKEWLDPLDLGVTGMNGSYAPCSGNGIAEQGSELIGVRPVPASDRVYVSETLTCDRVLVLDPTGRLVSEHRSRNIVQDGIDVMHLPVGPYLLRFLTGNEVQAHARLLVVR